MSSPLTRLSGSPPDGAAARAGSGGGDEAGAGSGAPGNGAGGNGGGGGGSVEALASARTEILVLADKVANLTILKVFHQNTVGK